MPEKIRVTILDEHKLFSLAHISLLLSKDFYIIGAYTNEEEFVTATITTNLPDILFFGYASPAESDLKVLKWVKSNYPCLKILVGALYENLTPFDELKKIGVEAVIVKNYDDTYQVANALKIVNEGQCLYP